VRQDFSGLYPNAQHQPRSKRPVETGRPGGGGGPPRDHGPSREQQQEEWEPVQEWGNQNAPGNGRPKLAGGGHARNGSVASTTSARSGRSRSDSEGIERTPRNAIGATIYSTWDWLVLFVLLMVPAVIYVLLFSRQGFAQSLDEKVSEMSGLSETFFGGPFVVGFLLYLFDVSYWEGVFWLQFRTFLFAVSTVSVLIGTVFAAKVYPTTPIVIYLGGNAFWILGIKRRLYANVQLATFLTMLSTSLFSVSVIVTVWWLGWAFAKDEFWTASDRQVYLKKLNCASESSCLAAYYLWISPMIYSLACFVLCFVCRALGRSLGKARSRYVALKVITTLICLGLTGLWVSAAVAGAGMKLSDSFFTLMMLALAGVAGVVASTIGWDSLKTSLAQIPLIKSMSSMMYSDWIKALFIVCAFPFIVMYAALSVVNQVFRVHFNFAKAATVTDEERHLWTTRVFNNQWQIAMGWKWSSVYEKIAFVSFYIVLLNVLVGKFTVVFLAWLNGALEPMSLAAVVIIFTVVGATMFLLPPVPGLPVYLSGGLIVTKAAEKEFGFWGACFFASVVSFLIKDPFALTMQQKLIGVKLKDNVAVKKLVGVNSISMRAVRMMLEKPGWSLGKVLILCGGPDWPTAVLTGILDLNWWDTVKCSIPVYFIVSPSVFASAFMLKHGDPWSSISSVIMAIAMLVQLMSMVGGAYFIEKTAQDHRQELEAMPIDAAVEAEEAKDRAGEQWFQKVSDWDSDHMTFAMKANLILAAIVCTSTMYVMMMMDQQCFKAFQLTDSISEKLNGSVMNLFRPMGAYAVVVFLFGCAQLWFHLHCVGNRVKVEILREEEQTQEQNEGGFQEDVGDDFHGQSKAKPGSSRMRERDGRAQRNARQPQQGDGSRWDRDGASDDGDDTRFRSGQGNGNGYRPQQRQEQSRNMQPMHEAAEEDVDGYHDEYVHQGGVRDGGQHPWPEGADPQAEPGGRAHAKPARLGGRGGGNGREGRGAGGRGNGCGMQSPAKASPRPTPGSHSRHPLHPDELEKVLSGNRSTRSPSASSREVRTRSGPAASTSSGLARSRSRDSHDSQDSHDSYDGYHMRDGAPESFSPDQHKLVQEIVEQRVVRGTQPAIFLRHVMHVLTLDLHCAG
jgi:hypothetical protein